jgi:hypothetical protein
MLAGHGGDDPELFDRYSFVGARSGGGFGPVHGPAVDDGTNEITRDAGFCWHGVVPKRGWPDDS